jgi:cell division protein FtsI/penicillin-binding protein 2
VFERRLKVLLGVLGFVMLVILVRLVELQLVHGSYYRQQTARNLLRNPVTLPFVRGSILDRQTVAPQSSLATSSDHSGSGSGRFHRGRADVA